jgi:hypothetical protein
VIFTFWASAAEQAAVRASKTVERRRWDCMASSRRTAERQAAAEMMTQGFVKRAKALSWLSCGASKAAQAVISMIGA